MKKASVVFGWLPVELIHRILPFLSLDDKINVKLLSKKWLKACRTYPKLNFDEMQFREGIQHSGYEEQVVRSKFRQHVNDTLLRTLSVYQLDIIMEFTGDDAAYLNNWLRIAVENEVRELTVHLVSTSSAAAEFAIPDFVLGAKSLTKLSVINCKFPDKLKAPIMCENIHSLILWDVSIDDDVLDSLIMGCPRIEHLKINNCEGLNTIKVINLPCLKDLHITDSYGGGGDDDDEGLSVEIDAPNVKVVDLSGLYQPQFVEWHAYPNLQSIELDDTTVTDAFFENFMNKFPNLKSLVLINCFGFERMNIASHSIESIDLILGANLPMLELVIDAPNLARLHIDRDDIPICSIKSVSIEMKCNVFLVCQSPIQTSWFARLNEMLSNLVPSTISLQIDLGDEFDYYDDKEPYNLLDGLFLACSPESIALDLNGKEHALLIVDCLQSKLTAMKNQGRIKEFKGHALSYDDGKWHEQPLEWVISSDLWKGSGQRTKVCFGLGWNSEATNNNMLKIANLSLSI